MATATVRARSNIALIKYWGKRDAAVNTPAVGSVSITLDGLWTDTTVRFDSALDSDSLLLNGREGVAEVHRVSACLDLIRERAGVSTRAQVESANNFPTAAGLASSASGFAALVGAAAAALNLSLSDRELSILARRGSGSAARSIFGGFVQMHKGEAADGNDSFAEPLLAADAWPLMVVVAITETEEKSVSSGKGMTRSAHSSPYYGDWTNTHAADMAIARSAILERDFSALAEVSEFNCLKMHAAAQTAQPPLIYWNGATVECIHRIRRLRDGGVPVFFTIDAGPQVKAVCLPGALDEVESSLRSLPGVKELLVTGLGPGLELRQGSEPA
jgi:diphosphomevalonate decarboxylase